MARYISLLILALLFLAGCASSAGLVDVLPSPNLNGPVVNGPVSPSPAPAEPAPAAPTRPQARAMNLPAGWIPAAQPRAWKWIVIHHSASGTGSAAIFDRVHREERGWDELGYHFVIGNGSSSSSADGQVEIGPRWPKQKWGAHAKTPDNRFNDYGIGICLVGDFDIDRPTPRQMQSLANLVAFLTQQYHIPVSNVLGHQDTHGTETDCPGRHFDVALLRRMVTQQIAATSGGAAPRADAR